MPRGRPVKYKSALTYFTVENILKRKGYDIKINRGNKVKPIVSKVTRSGKQHGRSNNS